MFFVFETAQTLLWFVPVVFQKNWPAFLPSDGFGFVDRIFWLLFVHQNPSSILSDKKQGRSGNQHIKSVPRYIRQTFPSKNKFPIYAYSAQLNIFNSYWLTGWYASVLVGKIFDDDGVDSLVVMAKKFLAQSPNFFYSIQLCCEKTYHNPCYITFDSSW